MKCKTCNSNKQKCHFRKYRRINKTGIKVYTCSKCKSCEYKAHCIWKQKNTGRFKELMKSHQPRKPLQGHEERMEKQRCYYAKRRKNDIEFRLVGILRRRLHHALKGCSKSSSTMELVGCTASECRRWIESQFCETMTWDNIVIDHKMPCASFDFRLPQEQQRCFHWSNLQPLTPPENGEKSDKIPENWVWKGDRWGYGVNE